MLALIKSKSVLITSNYPSKLFKSRFLANFKISWLFSRKQQKYLSCVVDNIIFGISVPDYPSRNVETTCLGEFCICLHFSRKQ